MADDGRPRGRRMDNGACLYYKLTYEAKGSGELIKSKENRPKINLLALFTCLEFSFTEICIFLLMNFLSFIWVSRRAKAKLFKCPWVNWWIYNENESCSCIWCWADKMRHAERQKRCPGDQSMLTRVITDSYTEYESKQKITIYNKTKSKIIILNRFWIWKF